MVCSQQLPVDVSFVIETKHILTYPKDIQTYVDTTYIVSI